MMGALMKASNESRAMTAIQACTEAITETATAWATHKCSHTPRLPAGKAFHDQQHAFPTKSFSFP
jgi:hypothetical protein